MALSSQVIKQGAKALAFPGVMGVMEGVSAKKQGDSFVMAAGKSILTNAAWMAVPGPVAWGAMAIQTGVPLAIEMGKEQAKSAQSLYTNKGGFGSGYVNMSEAGYTMRQRSLNAIRQNGVNMNSVLGNEARNYYSRY